VILGTPDTPQQGLIGVINLVLGAGYPDVKKYPDTKIYPKTSGYPPLIFGKIIILTKIRLKLTILPSFSHFFFTLFLLLSFGNCSKRYRKERKGRKKEKKREEKSIFTLFWSK
jgi:hypothetical protein